MTATKHGFQKTNLPPPPSQHKKQFRHDLIEMLNNAGCIINCCFRASDYAQPYLGNVKVEAEALSLPLHLPHAQLAGELAGAEAESLQSERAMQVPLGTVPDVVERDLLQTTKKTCSIHKRQRSGTVGATCLKHALTRPPA